MKKTTATQENKSVIARRKARLQAKIAANILQKNRYCTCEPGDPSECPFHRSDWSK